MAHVECTTRRQRFIETMAGSPGGATGASAAVMRGAAWSASGAYRLAIRARNWAYDHRLLAVRKLDRPVISVGNLSAGGTGKTVLAVEIARWIVQAKRRPAVLLRGYRSGSSPVGSDEGALMRELLGDVPVIANPDRYAAGRGLLASANPPDVFVLDDGFQHRRLHRDLDVVAIDATAGLTGPLARLLPRGLLREPVESLRRADCFVLTRVDQADPAAVRNLQEMLADIAPGKPVVRCRHAAVSLRRDGRDLPLESLVNRRYVAFCGLGNPAAFARTVEELPGCCAEFVAFDDHHAYSPADAAALIERVRRCNGDLLVTTRKDLVKLGVGGFPSDPPIYAVNIELEWLDGSAGQPIAGRVLDLVRCRR
jgi:tetraacyldisaccharide 4'-kinase